MSDIKSIIKQNLISPVLNTNDKQYKFSISFVGNDITFLDFINMPSSVGTNKCGAIYFTYESVGTTILHHRDRRAIEEH